jgi:hypothetical protein
MCQNNFVQENSLGASGSDLHETVGSVTTNVQLRRTAHSTTKVYVFSNVLIVRTMLTKATYRGP